MFPERAFFILLHCQTETEAGSAVEQPVRDRLDLYEIAEKRIVDLAILYSCNFGSLCLKKPFTKE